MIDHEPQADGSCSCGRAKPCPTCARPLTMLGYDSDTRHGWGHVWDHCRFCEG